MKRKSLYLPLFKGEKERKYRKKNFLLDFGTIS